MSISAATERQDRVHPRGLVLAVTCAGMFLVLLDVTIVNVALPRVARDLGAGVAGLLVTARVVQGVGAALLLPSTMATVADTYPERREQARALGTWAAASSLALPVGPLLGGVLVSGAGWRWVFWINVPLTLLAVVASLRIIPARPPNHGHRLDALGLSAFVVALAAAVYAVISAGHGARPVVWLGAAVIAGLTLGIGLWHEGRAAHPLLPVDLLRRRTFAAPNVVALTMNLVFNGLLFVATLYLQDVRGKSPVAAGALVLPLAVPLIALAPVSGRLTAQRGPRAAVSAGTAIAAAGALVLLGVTRTGSLLPMLAGFLLLGCGAGLVTASVVAAVVRATPPDRSGLATGVSNTARQVGTASGVAIFGAIAGSPHHPTRFVTGLHVAAAVATVLWVIALALAITGIDDAPADYARERA